MPNSACFHKIFTFESAGIGRRMVCAIMDRIVQRKGKRMKRLWICGLLLLWVVPVSAQENKVDFAPLVEFIEAQMQAQTVPGLAVAVIYQGEVVFAEGFGVRSIESEDPVTPATLFRIGSTTKPLTVTGLLRLVEAGLVDLDAPVVTYVPEFAVSDAITVRQLISHTAGLKDAATPYGRTDADALADYVASFDAESAFAPPGAVLSYSNPGFNTAGLVIERVSGQSYADYMAQQVFPALHMSRTTLYPNVAITYPLAVGHLPGRSGLEVVRPNPDNAAEYPAGFVFSSVEDLSNLALLLLQEGQLDGQPVLSADSVQMMQTPVLEIEPGRSGYGLGLFTGEWRGEQRVGHGGAINGYTTSFELLPEHELGVILLANVAGFNAEPTHEIVFDLLLDVPEPAPRPAPELDAAALEAYTGDFRQTRIDGAVVVTIRFTLDDNNRLIALSPDAPPIELRPLRPDVFNMFISGVPRPVGQVAFIRDADGQVQFASTGFRAIPRVG